MTMRDEALRLAECGLEVFPVYEWTTKGCACGKPGCRGKHPRTHHGHTEASSDPDAIELWWREWPHASIGIRPAERVVVLDVDAMAKWDELSNGRGKLTTPVAITGSGGLHVYMRTELPVRNRARFLPGLDTRTHEGFAIAPPSTHSSGERYRWIPGLAPWEVMICDVPDWLAIHLPWKLAQQAEKPAVQGDFDVERARSALTVLDPDCDHDAWIQIGMALHSTGAREAYSLWDGWSSGGTKYDGHEETAKRWRSFGRNGITELTLWKAARDAGWRPAPQQADEEETPEPKIELAGKSYTDLVRATAAVIRGASRQPLVYDEGALYRYEASTHTWDEVDIDAQRRALWSLDGARYPVVEPDGSTEWRQLKIRAADVKDVPPGISSCDRIPQPGFFGRAPGGALFRNAFVHCDGRVEEPTHKHRQRAAVSFDYDPEAPAPRFEDALFEWFAPDEDAEEKRLLLAEFVGACLLGVASEYQAGLLLVGSGANGKSVFIDIVTALFPPSVVRSVSPAQFGDQWYLASLRCARINVEADIPPRVTGASALKKAFTGDSLMAARKFRDPFAFRPKAGHLFSANQLPTCDDASFGFWRRWRVVEWNRRFLPHERDRHLASRIIATELPGVATWALSGARRLFESGQYTTVESSDAAIARWGREVDPILAWLSECTEPTEDREEGLAPRAAFAHFHTWATEEAKIGKLPGGQQTFFRRLTAEVGGRRVGQTRWYPIRLTH